jgi:hypothetical protein
VTALRLSWLLSWLSRAAPLALALVASSASSACGRAGLDDYLVGDAGADVRVVDGGLADGGLADAHKPDGASCGAATCPTGCCSGGVCEPGSTVVACGTQGQACQNCAAAGFPRCDAAQRACGGATTLCGPQTCGGGCCDTNTCYGGDAPGECGSGGVACAHCPQGLTCAGHHCVQPACGPQSCSGCCFGDQCLSGTEQTACGINGQACANCTASQQTCVSGGGIGGFCEGGPLLCTPQTCTGCCDANNACQPGFVNGACGQNGAACEDCSALSPPSTCDVSVTPRACTSQQTVCPSPYGACPPGLQTPAPANQAACSASDLQNAAAACTAGAHTSACQSFFQFEKSQNPACAACLAGFDYDFQELTALFECVAPFVGAACNHETACVVDCTDKSCATCVDPGAAAQCRAQVRTGGCAAYYQGAQCVGAALSGPAVFCDPSQYMGNLGRWLQGVGAHYCAQ